MCKSKDQGGLNVENIRDHNVALLSKWLWKSLNDFDSDWVNTLKARPFKRRKLETLDGGPIIGSSIFWKGVWKCRKSFKRGIIF